MAHHSAAMSAWQKLSGLPGGKWLFSRIVCWRAPYFGTIRPRFDVLANGRAVVRMRKRRRVQNHIGTVHAIAMCNLAEIAAGTMTDASIPATHRWIPKGMQVDYLSKAKTDIKAVATLPADITYGESEDIPVNVSICDKSGEEVVHAVITMRVSRRPN
jgi:acyl-coenzyme A thioesterase PaaI-like protein